MDKKINDDFLLIKKLGESMGYGHMMTIASVLWSDDLKTNGYPESGAFVPTILSFIKDDCKPITESSIKNYERLLENFKNNK